MCSGSRIRRGATSGLHSHPSHTARRMGHPKNQVKSARSPRQSPVTLRQSSQRTCPRFGRQTGIPARGSGAMPGHLSRITAFLIATQLETGHRLSDRKHSSAARSNRYTLRSAPDTLFPPSRRKYPLVVRRGGLDQNDDAGRPANSSGSQMARIGACMCASECDITAPSAARRAKRDAMAARHTTGYSTSNFFGGLHE
jgi:hypothetical protein